jgi:hypothetical protein
MLKKLVIIAVLIMIVVLFILIGLKFTGDVSKVIDSEKPVEIKDKRIRLVSTDCTDGKLTMRISNDGNTLIEKGELRVIINDVEKTENFIDSEINPADMTSYSDLITAYSGKLNIKVEGPDNTIGWGVTC